jgi:AraC-like DNA-binding protein
MLDSSKPALRALPVGAIGARWGFVDPAHFSRVFKAAYGMPPGEFRSAL